MEQQKQQTKRKNSGFYALIALLLIITIVASGLGIYAWAKYTSSVNGNAAATVAKWSFNVNLKKGGNTVTLGSEAIDLATTANHVANNRIAPGTSGTFDIEIDTTGTEVDMQYEVTLGLTYCPRNITFSRKTGVNDQNEDVFTPISEGGASSLTRTGITFSEYVAHDAQNRVITERIKWDWPYEDANDEDYDTRDKEDEIAIADTNHHTTMTINVTGTEQLEPPAAPKAIGDTVNYSTTLNGVTLDNWKVFYVDGDYTYLILSDNLPENAIDLQYICEVEGGIGFDGDAYFQEHEYTGLYHELVLKKALSNRENWDELLTGTINGHVINESRSENIWAAGSPDVELFVNSWNASYPDAIIHYETENRTDWYDETVIAYSFEELEFGSLSDTDGYNNTLYFVEQVHSSGAYSDDGYWLASYSCDSSSEIDTMTVAIDYAGNIGRPQSCIWLLRNSSRNKIAI